MDLCSDISVPGCAFTHDRKILFRHCDPAGIVFYPRYFEMINDTVEAFFDHIGHPFETVHAQGATPTVEAQAHFANPSRHGDRLRFALWLARIGRTSANFHVTAHAGQEPRVIFRSVVVRTDLHGRPMPWSDAFRRAFTPYLKNEDD